MFFHSGLLGLQHILRIYGRALDQRPSGSQKSCTQILPVGAVHPLVSGLSILHTTLDMARSLHQIRSQHSQPGPGGPQLPVERKVPGSRQDHALHDQVSRPVLVHEAEAQRRHLEKVRLRYPAALLH
jgi:hypothetical protein